MRKSVAYLRLFTNGLAALRCPCSRLQVLCLPSVASPFAGPSVHWTLAFSRLTHPRTTGSFLCVPKEKNRKKGHPGLPCREAPMPRVQGRTGAACAPHREFRCGVPSLEACLGGSGQGPFFAPAFSASLESPGFAFRGEPARRDDGSLDRRLFPPRPCPWPGRTPCCASLSLLLLASPGLAVRGEPVQRGNPCAAHSLLRLGTGPSLPWLGRSPGRASTGHSSLSGSPTGPLP
jgi:hypothetical protein